MHDPTGDLFLQYEQYGTIVEDTGGGLRYGDPAGHCGAEQHDDPAEHYDRCDSGMVFDAPRPPFTVTEGNADWRTGDTYVFPRQSPLHKDPEPMGAKARSHSPRARRRRDPVAASWPRTVSLALVTLRTLAFTTVCLLGWMFSYDPLHDLALSRTPGVPARLWPIVVFGPWLVGCLSVLRAANDGRRVVHSWLVVVLFSTVCSGLCVADASRRHRGGGPATTHSRGLPASTGAPTRPAQATGPVRLPAGCPPAIALTCPDPRKNPGVGQRRTRASPVSARRGHSRLNM
ncbi:hypothetical protein BX265_0192 [Streptomyces sp. TLI_235]|nr:hypothetical protein BX265_0192 [Streptomyces sp. TLI_235]